MQPPLASNPDLGGVVPTVMAFGLQLAWPPLVAAALLVSRMPEPLALALATPIGWCLKFFHRHRILSNAGKVLNPASVEGRNGKQFLSKHFKQTGLSLLEPLIFYGLTHEQMKERTTIKGEDNLRAVLQSGRGGILLLNHFGSIAAIAAALGPRGYDLTIAGSALNLTLGKKTYPLHKPERFACRLLEYGGVKRATLGRDMPRNIAATVKRNGLMGLFIDVSMARKHNEAFAFGRSKILAHLGPAIMALRVDADVLCVSSKRLGKNRHLITISPPLKKVANAPREQAARVLMQKALDGLSTDLLSRPEQWWQWDFAPICSTSKPDRRL